MIALRRLGVVVLAAICSCAAPVKVASNASAVPPKGAFTSRVRIEVRNVHGARGSIVVALYDDASAFPKREAAVRSARSPAVGDPTVVELDAVPSGRYAAVVYQDVDDDGALDRSLVGYPTEPFGFSNDASLALFGPPSFDDCAFVVGPASVTIAIHLR